MLDGQCTLTSDILGKTDSRRKDVDTVIVAADITLVENITALKSISKKLTGASRRIFIIEGRGRLAVVQAYALGATHVLSNPVKRAQLLEKLVDASLSSGEPGAGTTQEAASAGAATIASMFSAVMSGSAIDVAAANHAGGKNGLSEWLTTVRRHHEGTYQHCLLVTGVAVDFGLSLGLAKADVERLYSAAMFHDIGKAKIPLVVLDKPGRLDEKERALIETHPAMGYDVLKATPGISPEILDAVRHHHEYLDGSGYPDALCAGSIADLVRILTISDIFAALIEHRTYKPTMPREKAYEILSGMNGKLEPALVGVFKEVALNR
jgi:putative nucleotidyltransferase with HDIG domain